MGHNHSHDLNGKRLIWAVLINVLLTAFQIVGGILSGSLSLLADALHNFSDAGALAIAAIAARIAKIPADKRMTYGYKRAEIIGALINSSSLLFIGFYLLYEALSKITNPAEIDGWIVVIVAIVALVIDVLTALLTYSGSKNNINMKAAFIHNMSDAMASVVVIISGSLIILYQLHIVDLIATILISGYVLYHALLMIKQCILILMQSAPEGLDIDVLTKEVSSLNGVLDFHHVHVWSLDDNKVFLEGHVKIDSDVILKTEEIKERVRKYLKDKYSILHTTLEVEIGEECLNDC